MKQINRSLWGRFSFLLGCIVVLAFTAYCHLPGSKDLPAPHLAIFKNAGETLCVDTLDNHLVFDKDNPGNATNLRCFLISWSDHLPEGDEMGLLQRQNYFQNQMQQDWLALVGGDSVHPLFFRQKPLLNRHLRQGALVFSLPPGGSIDTLVYRGTDGFWKKQLINVKGK